MISLILLFAGIVACHIESSQAGTSKHPNRLATITPDGTHAPVTITAQYQTVPSYAPDASTYARYLWVSTIITDADGELNTVTRTEEPITIRHTKTTFTHTTTCTQYGYVSPTGTNFNTTLPSKYTISEWEELYELIGEAKFKDLGPMALRAYPGSGLCTKKCHGEKGITYQPAHLKEYQHGKWSSYNTTYTYGLPTLITSTYASPGTYTVPAYSITVYQTTTVPTEATITAPAGSPVTYGGVTTSVDQPCTITAQYAAYKTEGMTTRTIIQTTTIRADKPGIYIIVKPTITRYDHDTRCTYPTTTIYLPGVYHHTRETVMVTKSHQSHVYSYHSSSTRFVSYEGSQHSSTSKKHVTQTPTNAQSSMYVPSSIPSTVSHSPSSVRSTHRHTTSAVPSSSKPSSTNSDDDNSATSTGPTAPDPSSDYEEPEESYGTAYVGYGKRGGVLERRGKKPRARGGSAKRVILV